MIKYFNINISKLVCYWFLSCKNVGFRYSMKYSENVHKVHVSSYKIFMSFHLILHVYFSRALSI